jgi:hypothetical protein
LRRLSLFGRATVELLGLRRLPLVGPTAVELLRWRLPLFDLAAIELLRWRPSLLGLPTVELLRWRLPLFDLAAFELPRWSPSLLGLPTVELLWRNLSLIRPAAVQLLWWNHPLIGLPAVKLPPLIHSGIRARPVFLPPSFPQIPHLTLGPGAIVLDIPVSLAPPVVAVAPAPPIAVEMMSRYALIAPRAPIPAAGMIIPSPVRIHVEIENRHGVVVGPSPVIILGTVPAAVPQAPPPTVPEIQVIGDIRHGVHIVGFGKHNNLRTGDKGDRRRQGDPEMDINLRFRRHGIQHNRRQKDHPQ